MSLRGVAFEGAVQLGGSCEGARSPETGLESKKARVQQASGPLEPEARRNQATATGIFPILACHSFGPVMCADVPPESTATVTGMSTTSNS